MIKHAAPEGLSDARAGHYRDITGSLLPRAAAGWALLFAMLAGIFQELGHAEQEKHEAAHHLDRGKQAREARMRNDVAVANRADADNGD
jgi:hypothetical protein